MTATADWLESLRWLPGKREVAGRGGSLVERRVAGLVVDSCDIGLELDAPEAECFRSRTVVRFSCEQPAIVADLAASSVESVMLNGVRD